MPVTNFRVGRKRVYKDGAYQPWRDIVESDAVPMPDPVPMLDPVPMPDSDMSNPSPTGTNPSPTGTNPSAARGPHSAISNPPFRPLVVNINLHRCGGATIRFFPNFLANREKQTLQQTMLNCRLYRQYYWAGGIKEPRVHVLLNDTATVNNGYAYHGVNMRSLPLTTVPAFEDAARKYARMYNLPNDQWAIGCDLICYRSGHDSVGWHSDDTHDETTVLCVVVESEGDRPVHIRPNERVEPLRDGDEEVELYVREGDAYELDEHCQHGYLHRLPKREKVIARRMVAIFRHGKAKSVEEDTGEPKDAEEYVRRC